MRDFLIKLLLWSNWLADLGLAVTYNDSKALLGDLLAPSRYNKEIRPKWNQLMPTNVNLAIGLLSIIELNDVSQRFKASAYASIWWHDELLQWNVSDYGGVQQVRLNPSKVWKPTFFLSNTFDQLDPFDDKSSKIVAYASGNVLWQTGNVLEMTCTLDVEKFPFDEQICSIWLCTFGYTTKDLNISAYDEGIYPTSAEWDASSSGYGHLFVPVVYTTDLMPCVHFMYTLKRKASVFVLTIILPVILMSLINNLVFVIPVESGEKISFAVTVLLALALFMTLISNMLPRSSVPKITVLLCVLMVLSVLAVVLTIVIVAIYHANETPEEAKPYECDRKHDQIADKVPYTPTLPLPSNAAILPTEDNHVTSTTKRKISRFFRRPRDFKRLARYLDILCFVLFNSVVLVTTAWYFIVVKN